MTLNNNIIDIASRRQTKQRTIDVILGAGLSRQDAEKIMLQRSRLMLENLEQETIENNGHDAWQELIKEHIKKHDVT